MIPKKLHTFTVSPYLPEPIRPLMEIAYNLWWSWNRDALILFYRMDPELWERSHHNPIRMFGMLPDWRLNELVDDEVFIAHMNRVYESMTEYMNAVTWYKNEYGESDQNIAYFSAEFGIHESLRLYSGGLGILAGDHLKSASDTGLPLIGIGLCYKYGYFKQYLNLDGWQQESYTLNDFSIMPITLVKNDKNVPVVVELEFPGRTLYMQIYKVVIGRISLYLLDTDVEQNIPEDRKITHQLYGGDNETRLKQELVLGIGGMRLIKKLNLDIGVYHMNEGHSAFLALQRLADLKSEFDLNFDEAKEVLLATSVFTTHTPVPAGIDVFPIDLIDRYLNPFCEKTSLDLYRIKELGFNGKEENRDSFNMAIAAMRCASMVNGVSKLHGETSRKMWHYLWPQLDEIDLPIGHVTNGIHLNSWTGDEMGRLLDRYLGPGWQEEPEEKDVWSRVDSIPDSEIWNSRERLCERLIGFVRTYLVKQLERRGEHKLRIEEAEEVLNPDVLTIGFARRFATYKRGTLLFKDLERLEKILLNKEKPVQIIFAGKAHPLDNPGKELIKEIVHLSEKPQFRNKIVFLENYNIEIARHLVQGVDVWLNTPRRPLEASGTSGMKVCSNGGLNISIPDGWWVEGYDRGNGWSIGNGEVYDDLDLQDKIESDALYNLLERQVIPMFYNRDINDVPKHWIKTIKNSIKTICPFFNTNRMVTDYFKLYYSYGLINNQRFVENNMTGAKKLVNWKSFIHDEWNNVCIEKVITGKSDNLKSGDMLNVDAYISTGKINSNDIIVQLCYGTLDAFQEIKDTMIIPMKLDTNPEPGKYKFKTKLCCNESGLQGFSIRVIPYNDYLTDPISMGLVRWWQE